jgi:hypothetical protein
LNRADAVFSSNELTGPIPRLLEKVMGVLETEASVITDKTKDFLSGAQNRRRYSLQALHELLVNALVHRNYQDRLSTKIYIFQDRIEFESPGGLVDFESIDAARQGRSRWRNPSLARYLVELGLAQERGTGIPKAIKETIAMAGVEPVFEADSWFKVTVPAYNPSPSKRSEEVISPQAGALLISIGFGVIEAGLVHRSSSVPGNGRRPNSHLPLSWSRGVGTMAGVDPRAEKHASGLYGGRSVSGVSSVLPRTGSARPLIGAMAVGRKPLIVYFYDEDSSLYRFGYRLDRRLLQEP